MPKVKENERDTRANRIDPKFNAAGWRLPPKGVTPLYDAFHRRAPRSAKW